MSEFEDYSYTFDGNEGALEGVTLTGPTVACVAWIPFYADTSEMPECAYRSHPLLAPRSMRPSALSVLFTSGNVSEASLDTDPSPVSFRGRTQFLKLIESRNYRGALALDEVKLTLTDVGKPLRLEAVQRRGLHSDASPVQPELSHSLRSRARQHANSPAAG